MIIKNKRGVSVVVETVLLIALTMAVVSIIWVVTDNLVNKNIESSEACFGIFNEVELNSRYTCYNMTSGQDELWFSINVRDIEKVDDILVSIVGNGGSETFKIVGDNPSSLQYYNRTRPATGNMSIPGKNQGVSYIYTLPPSFVQEPEKVEIALIIDEEICGNINPINEFDSCSALIN